LKLTKFFLILGLLISASLCHAESVYEIGVFVGYIDQHPSPVVIDGQEEEGLISFLSTPCQGPHLFCGFEPTSDMDIFKKSIGKHEVVLHFHSSSLSNYDPDNRTNPEQKQKSQETAQEFLHSLQQDKAVFYLGHARYGYGPDFFPATLNNAGLVDHDLYHGNHRNLQIIEAAIASAKTLEFLSLSSCDAESHFDVSLQNANPHVQLLFAQGVVSPLAARKDFIKNMETVLQKLSR